MNLVRKIPGVCPSRKILEIYESVLLNISYATYIGNYALHGLDHVAMEEVLSLKEIFDKSSDRASHLVWFALDSIKT